MRESGCALITGASSGIGECFARALAARQTDLALAARSKDKLTTLSHELRRAHRVRVEPIDLDLSAPAAAAELVRRLRKLELSIGLLVNNAGFGAHGEFWRLPLDRQLQMLRLNINAVVELTHLLLPAMIERRSGAIINVSSTASFQPVPYTCIYGATKAFVTSFSMALREELRPYGIRVVTLCPGGTKTNFFRASEYKTRQIPGGMQTPEEVVKAALTAVDRGGRLVVPGFFNKLGVVSQRLAPRTLVARMVAKVFRPR